MPRLVAILLVLAALAPAASVRAASPVARARPLRLTKAEADSVTKAILKDRADTEQWLKSDATSYLATVQRVDFGARSALTVGGAPDNGVPIADPTVSAHHLRATVAGDSFHVEALDPGATFQVKGEALRSAVVGPSSIKVGRFTLRLSHQRYPAIIVFDPQSPHFKADKGLKWFPVDLTWRYELALTPDPKPDTVIILSTRGNRRRAVRMGWFEFVTPAGAPCHLAASRLLEPGVGENDLSLFFRDATTGRESYGTGRYLDPERLPDGRYLLDFNLCYNPACAVSEHYNCPIPPRENVLKVAVRAGEMDAHYH
jgi:hypothetical protein